ncbi:acyltransferase family protein [Oerskovia jenensis]|uniref:Peptidoglycan/LPS O-acetylase OafA/YrhL n=1 Tax=Oerskovia jenensis TaxID=162169 RepID=A0ABS2LDL1_9CELL|nr:acyltransferase family protein [Oerskovia jenensis]MBM7477899.1 peptidoglycan/LPS O-acetylase OafA/YrhL [Oerskovia jenensis]
MSARTGRERPGFRGDVEGLRALAVVLVLLFHAQVPGVLGGYVGVDVFFAISGFLITGILLRQLASTGRIALPAFFAGRARRILPAASVVLAGTALAAWLVLPPLRARDTMVDVVASALQVANLRFIAQETDYMAAAAAPSPVLHYWSLAVEEQFYVVVPLLLALVGAVASRTRRSPVPAAVAVLAVGTVASFVVSLALTSSDPAVAYMSPLTRAWQFGLGGLLAAALLRRPDGVAPLAVGDVVPARGRLVLRRVAWTLTGWAGLGVVVWSALAYDESTPFPGTAAAWPTLGTVAVLAVPAAVRTARGSVGHLLALAPVRAVGRLSFAWYLVHWPVLVLADAAWGPLTWPQRVVLTIGAGGVAWLVLQGVESPLRRSHVVALRPSASYSVGFTGVVLALTASLGAGSAVYADLEGEEVASAQVRLDTIFEPAALARTGGPVTPGLTQAALDAPPAETPCLGSLSLSSTNWPAECVVGPADGRAVVLFGDSKAFQWSGALRDIALAQGWRLSIVTKGGCTPADLPQEMLDESQHCETWRDAQIDRIADRADVVIVGSSAAYFEGAEGADRRERAWASTLGRFAAAGVPVVYLRDTPTPVTDVPSCVSGALDDWDACSFSRAEALPTDPLLVDVALGDVPGVEVVDVSGVVCAQADRCPAVLGGLLLYRDGSHLTATAVQALRPELERRLVETSALGG